MTRFLASIAAVDELPPVLKGGADLIDVKDPATGALGAADLDTIRAIVTAVAGRRWVSATLGDLPMEPVVLVRAARRTASDGTFTLPSTPTATILPLCTTTTPIAISGPAIGITRAPTKAWGLSWAGASDAAARRTV